MLDWVRDGGDWPNREASRFVEAGDTFWHVQVMGPDPAAGAPVALLLHGTAGASHSWRDVAPLLADDFTVIAPDLPGHGFTSIPRRSALSLPGMSSCLAALLAVLGVTPAVAVGHSAGAAILAHMAIEGRLAPRVIVSFNGAFLPFRGLAGQVFPPLARMLALNPFIPHGVSKMAEPATVARLMEGIGSALDQRGQALYRKLFASQAHVSATLGMMASWDLKPLGAALPYLKVPLELIVGTADRAVPPSDAEEVARRVPVAHIVPLPGLGHLAHEEQPETAATLVRQAFARFAPETP
jgi:magnesium chelatase accessory protein